MEEKEISQLIAGLAQKNTDLLTNISAMQNEIKSFGSAQQGTKDTIDRILADEQKMRDDLKAISLKFESTSNGQPEGEKSAGQKFVESERFKNLTGSGGHISGPVSVKSFERKDVTGATASAGNGLPAATRLAMFANPKIPLRVRDLLNVVPTTSTSIEYVKYTFTNAAKIIYDGTASPPKKEGVAKPKSDLTMTRATATVETIAHWVAASKQILSDIPQLKAVIDTELNFGLKLVEEQEILLGAGTAGHLNGLVTQATAFNTSLVGAGATKLDTLRAAILQARLAQYPVDGMVLNPQDLFDIEIAKDTQGRYIVGDPFGMMGPRLWGKPTVESDSITYETFLVGAFAMGAVLYDREEANIETRDTHANFFVENMIAIRAEERLILVVMRPQAFVKGSLA